MGRLTILTALFALFASGLLFAADPKPAPSKKSAAKEPAYQPLIMPEKKSETGVPAPKQELPAEKNEKNTPAEADSTVRPTGLFMLQEAEEKEKTDVLTGPLRQKLWIFTQPQEDAALAEQRRAEDRRIAESERAESKLPGWALDPQYRKYSEGTEPEKGLWKTEGPLYPTKTREDDESVPARIDSKTPTAPTLDRPLFPSGTSLSTGSETAKPDPGFLGVSPIADTKPAEKSVKDYGSFYQSNQKEKRVEDFYSGVNKPTTTDREMDRHHKPQKPL